MSSLRRQDPQIADAVQNEGRRQRENINLIASENYASRAVLEAQGSALTNKYAEGYPGRRYYGGCEFIDVAERLAIPARIEPLRSRPRQRPASFRRAGEHGRVLRVAPAWGYGDGTGPRPWWSPDPRQPGELLIEAVRIRTLLRGPRGGADRLRRGRTARQAALAQADRHRRHGLHAHHRLLTIQGDRGPGGRESHGGHGAHRGAGSPPGSTRPRSARHKSSRPLRTRRCAGPGEA